ncbi:MAG: sulfite exporter TauE/SafE family protein [Candidatus Levybacteria bacterium]|nr:sulfite exporter TauE/SafE family protein [Candidatus Levybacteria bacterium]MDZ4228211.1 sulfite exporter TauE/SafE family protein [Candidatus Levybacteria bacterium]
MDLWLIFITGLTVGGLTCLAVQGGLLASVIAAKEEQEIKKGINRRSTIFPTLAFLLAKLVAYTILGFILGAFGGAIGISQTVQIIMQFVAGAYMVAVAFNLLNVHPIFRYAIIQPPKFLTRKIRNQSRSKELFAPAFLGAMTVFIPCGTTLAMGALAISSGNAFVGAAILFVFVLGTMPLFFGLGFVTSVLGDNFRQKFLRIAAIAVLYLGLSSVNGSLVASGSPVTAQSMTEDVLIAFGGKSNINGNDAQVTQNAEIVITSSGYSPNYIKVKNGLPVNITLKSVNAYSCALAFRIPSLGIVRNLGPNEVQVITFTPERTGRIPFSCSMGMYAGVIEVI